MKKENKLNEKETSKINGGQLHRLPGSNIAVFDMLGPRNIQHFDTDYLPIKEGTNIHETKDDGTICGGPIDYSFLGECRCKKCKKHAFWLSDFDSWSTPFTITENDVF